MAQTLPSPLLQPKLQVANYLAQHGFAVPATYPTFSAMACRSTYASGVPFRIPLWVLSDGRRALMKLLQPA